MTAGPKAPQRPLLAVLLFVMGVVIGNSVLQGSSAAPASVSPPPPLLQQGAADRFHQAPCPAPRQPDLERRNLVFAAVGDGWTPDRWSFSEQAGWDLIAVYYGNRSDWSCPQCTLALHMPDSMKWQMIWTLMTADDEGGGSSKAAGEKSQWAGMWKKIRSSYDYVMVSDDDLIMDACTIDIFFESMRRHKLLAAQPSNCRGHDSDNPYWVHWQLPGLELHYVNIIEVTAPGLEMEFLDSKMRPYLEHTFSGWGLPLCFWQATGRSANKLAAIDAACMIHPARKDVGKVMSVSERIQRGLVKPGSIYARFGEITPFKTPRDEQVAVWQECGYEVPPPSERTRRFLIFGTVLAEPQEAAAEAGRALLPGLPAALASAQRGAPQEWLGGEALRGQPWRQPIMLMCMLALVAGVGAAAAVQWERRAKDSGHLPLARALR